MSPILWPVTDLGGNRIGSVNAPDTGSLALTPYTPETITGWAAGPTVACSYVPLGTKVVFVQYFIDGTSNGVSALFSLPPLGNPKAIDQWLPLSLGSTAIGERISCYGIVPASTPNAWFYLPGDRIGGWPVIGRKMVAGQFFYELA